LLKRDWETLLDVVDGKSFERPPVALIVDSPWLPDYAGITHLDYYLHPDLWLKINLQLKQDYPNIIFVPSFWVEYGMANEPSALGCLVRWSLNDMPTVEKRVTSPEEISRLRVPNPEKDGLMPLVLNLYQYFQGKLDGTGHEIKIVAARGPLTVASFVYGLTELLMGIRIEPDWMKKLLEITTETAITWLKAQLKAVPSAEGILLLDDIPGLMSKEDYTEFAHPYLEAVFSEFSDKLKLYHNDANTTHILPLLTELDIDIFNFGKEVPLAEIYRYTAGKMVVMGNISPLETLREKGPEEVRKEVEEFLKEAPDKYLLLSAGGGVSPGTPKENIAVLNEMGAVLS